MEEEKEEVKEVVEEEPVEAETPQITAQNPVPIRRQTILRAKEPMPQQGLSFVGGAIVAVIVVAFLKWMFD